MKVIVDISYYPLNVEFVQPIEKFIERLNKRNDLEIKTNETSTHITGEYHVIMQMLQEEMHKELEAQSAVFVMRIVGRKGLD